MKSACIIDNYGGKFLSVFYHLPDCKLNDYFFFQGFAEPFSHSYYSGAERLSTRWSFEEVPAEPNATWKDIKQKMEGPFEGICFVRIIIKMYYYMYLKRPKLKK